MDPAREYFAEWLTRTLANRGFSGGEVARAIGVNGAAVSRWRNGKGTPGIGSCVRLASFLGVDPIRLAVTAGLMSAEDVRYEPLPLPEQTAKREQVREQIMKITGLTDGEKTSLLDAWERRNKHDDDHLENGTP